MHEVQPSDPLNEPSHAGEHNALNTAVRDLGLDLTDLTNRVDELDPQVHAARMAAHAWSVPGPIPVPSDPPALLMPLVWNMTGHHVHYFAATATVFSPPVGGSILIDIVSGTTVSGGTFDEVNMTTILASPLEIPDGQYTSAKLTEVDFVGEMAIGSFVAVYVQQVGVTEPGSDLMVQLNRLL